MREHVTEDLQKTNAQRQLAMDIKDFQTMNQLVGAVATAAKGSTALLNWMSKRTDKLYEEFIGAATEGHVFLENAEAMTPDDLFAILRSLEMDMESEKAALYGRLACSIAKGFVAREHKLHFIKALRELSYTQVQRLRRAWVTSRYDLRPAEGAGRRAAKDALTGGVSARIDEAALQQFALADSEKLTDVGMRFVEACFLESELTPSSIGERQWATGVIQIICNEMDDAACIQFICKLTADGQAQAIKVTNCAAIKNRHTQKVRKIRGSLVVLLFRDPDKLTREWNVVESITQKGATFVAASFGANKSKLPAPLAGIEHFDISVADGRIASERIIALFDRFGYGGNTDR